MPGVISARLWDKIAAGSKPAQRESRQRAEIYTMEGNGVARATWFVAMQRLSQLALMRGRMHSRFVSR
jgi:hypothetical protein